MLTKELIISRFRGSRIIPAFISTDDESLLQLAAQMIDCFRTDAPKSEIEDALNRIHIPFDNLKLVNGLRKILMDRAVFSSSADLDFQAERRKILLKSAELLRNSAFSDEITMRNAVKTAVQSPLLENGGGIYTDLPDNDRLVSLRNTSPAELLERYNLGLVQGLLLTADKLELQFKNPTPASLRYIFSRIRFNRLVAQAALKNSRKQGTDGDVFFTIDGPASVLEQSRAYGLQLALFLPAVCVMKNWNLKAQIHIKNSVKTLELDQSSNLRERNAHAEYVPEEISAFIQNFTKSNHAWIPEKQPELLKTKNAKLIFPDFTFKNPDGKTAHLELFHRWHTSQLLERLKDLDNNPTWKLAIGVEKSLAEKPDIKEKLEASACFAAAGFVYRDFPTPAKVIAALDSLCTLSSMS